MPSPLHVAARPPVVSIAPAAGPAAPVPTAEDRGHLAFVTESFGPGAAKILAPALHMLRMIAGDVPTRRGYTTISSFDPCDRSAREGIHHCGSATFAAGDTGVTAKLFIDSTFASLPRAVDVGFHIPSTFVGQLAEPAADFVRLGLGVSVEDKPFVAGGIGPDVTAHFLRAVDVAQQVDPNGDVVVVLNANDHTLDAMPARLGAEVRGCVFVAASRTQAVALGMMPWQALHALAGHLPDVQVAAAREAVRRVVAEGHTELSWHLERTACAADDRARPGRRPPREILLVTPQFGPPVLAVEPSGRTWKCGGSYPLEGDYDRLYVTANHYGWTFGASGAAWWPEQQPRAVAKSAAARESVIASARAKEELPWLPPPPP